MMTDGTYIDRVAAKMFKKLDHRSDFNVSVDGCQGGKFTLFS
jgi:hypothetical protein